MADWTVISDSQVDPDAPITSELGYAFRDNPIAIAEGAAGAPRIQDAALGGTVTTAGRNWVAARSSAQALHALGAYVMAVRTAGGVAAPGDIVPGSQLASSNAAGTGASSLPGNWRCQGLVDGGSLQGNTTLWQRVS